jgi:hypothetical protein
MNIHPIPRLAGAAALVLAPLLGLVAAVATPGLSSTRAGEIAAIGRDPSAFKLYAVTALLSSYLLVPAYFALMALIRTRSPRWSYLAGGLAQAGMLVAIGDAGTELMYSQMGAPSADPAQMTALAERFESFSSVVYGPGGLFVVAGTVLVGIALWRTRVVPRWTGVALAVSMALNVGGFTAASKPLLIASYLVMLGCLGRIALVVLGSKTSPELLPADVLVPSV